MKTVPDFLKKNIIPLVLLTVFMVASIFTGTMIGTMKQEKETQKWQIKYDGEHQAVQLISKQNTEYAQAASHTLTKEQFKEQFAENFKLFAKELKLKDINHFTEVQTFTEHKFQTTLNDSTIINRDTTHVKTFSFTSRNLDFSGYSTADRIYAKYQHRLSLQIASGKKEREGFWKKITLQPLKRETIVQAVADDSNTVITNIKSIKIR